MFTGIVETQAQVVRRTSGQLVLQVKNGLSKLQIGESIAVDGVCLTAAAFKDQEITFRLLRETTRASTLGKLKVGESVNLERSLKVGDRLGGHWLLGHVDGRGTLTHRKRQGSSQTLTIAVPGKISRWLVPKGPIGINGVSLTLDPSIPAAPAPGTVPGANVEVQVHLIPHTAQATALGQKPVGSQLNIETDLIAKYLNRML